MLDSTKIKSQTTKYAETKTFYDRKPIYLKIISKFGYFSKDSKNLRIFEDASLC